MIDVVDLLIIGSGISGLSAALEAKKYFKNVLIIDKGYHSGGRICSKKINSFCFNHGAPYINKSSKNFNLGFSIEKRDVFLNGDISLFSIDQSFGDLDLSKVSTAPFNISSS